MKHSGLKLLDCGASCIMVTVDGQLCTVGSGTVPWTGFGPTMFGLAAY